MKSTPPSFFHGLDFMAGSSNTEVVANHFLACGNTICYYFGSDRYQRQKCPFRGIVCSGYYQSVRQASLAKKIFLSISNSFLSSLFVVAAHHRLYKAAIQIEAYSFPLPMLVDTCGSENYISQQLVQKHH